MRKQDKSSNHTVPSFAGYLNKVFDFRSSVASLSDARHAPGISPQAVFLSAFYGFVFRLPSFQQLEADLENQHLQQWVGVEGPFSDDALRYSLCGFDLSPLEQMLVRVNRVLKRNKAFEEGRVQGRIVAALDGIEVLSSYSRSCEQCLERRVKVTDAEGHTSEQLQYYHRLVGCQIVSSKVKPFLAVEWVRPGEGEDTAALRLLARIPKLYGSPFFDILLLDSLYAQAPVLQLAEQVGWDLVITLKQEARELYQNASHLFASRGPELHLSQTEDGRGTEANLWETDGLPFTQDHPQPVRVVHSQEKVTVRHYRRRTLVTETTDHTWWWITTLDPRTFPVRQVWQLGHMRWKNENNGWNDLTQNWALKHDFLHACKHRPKSLSASGERECVPNRGLAAVVLILCLAFALGSAFTLLHSKLVRRYGISALEVARQLYRSLWQWQPPIRAPASDPAANS
jgi:hypothetical protein